MLFKRKPKNRRLRREFLLDVKLRSQQVQATRFRWAGITFGVLFGVVFAGLVLWRGGEWLLDRFVYGNEAFTIRQVQVQNEGVIAPEFIRRWAMLKPGQNLLALDLAKVKRDLELVPLIQSASVERVLPNTLKIRVDEREPVAQVPMMQLKAGGGYEQVIYHVDQSGFVFHPLDPRLRAKPPESVDQLPVISGVDARELRAGRPVDSEQIKAVLELIHQFDHSPMLGFVDLLRIDVSTPEILHLYTTQGSEIFFSLNNVPQQLRRWRLVYDQTLRWNKAIGSLDLSVENNAPLRLVEATPGTAPRSRNQRAPSRTQTNRRTNAHSSNSRSEMKHV
jgi:cell division septal protein FtsQ